jgi:hypothetical protein
MLKTAAFILIITATQAVAAGAPRPMSGDPMSKTMSFQTSQPKSVQARQANPIVTGIKNPQPNTTNFVTLNKANNQQIAVDRIQRQADRADESKKASDDRLRATKDNLKKLLNQWSEACRNCVIR